MTSDNATFRRWRWYEFQRRITLFLTVVLFIIVIVLHFQLRGVENNDERVERIEYKLCSGPCPAPSER